MGDSGIGDRDDRIEVGVALLAASEDATLSMAEAVTRLEAITSAPSMTRSILDEAERRGVITRDDGVVRVRSGEFVRYQSQVYTRDGEFECRRCGAGLSTGYFIEFDAGTLGPFGSSCVRKVTGRDD